MENSSATGAGGGSGGQNEEIPFMQRVLDNPFTLLFIGVAIPTVFYTIWGIIEVVSIPLAK